jgi:type I restriction enzyme R subunit
MASFWHRPLPGEAQRVATAISSQNVIGSRSWLAAVSSRQNDEGDPRPVAYNSSIPIEQFDFIVTDECHRSIYGLWRQVLGLKDSLESEGEH